MYKWAHLSAICFESEPIVRSWTDPLDKECALRIWLKGKTRNISDMYFINMGIK